MAQVNPLTRELLVKLVYYGPGLGGKTTSLQRIHQASPPETRGQIVSLATPLDRTLYFDFLPLRAASVRGHHVRLQLFTVPGQVYFNATRKLVLTGADGIVLAPQHSRTMTACVRRAADAGLPVVVVDTNVARAVDALRAPGAAKTYDARERWVREQAARLDLRVFGPNLPAYSPRLVQEALYVFCSKSNRVARGDGCSSRSSPCAACAPALCPFTSPTERQTREASA